MDLFGVGVSLSLNLIIGSSYRISVIKMLKAACTTCREGGNSTLDYSLTEIDGPTLQRAVRAKSTHHAPIYRQFTLPVSK